MSSTPQTNVGMDEGIPTVLVMADDPHPQPQGRDCACSLPHVGIPAWLDPTTSDWQKQAERVGVPELLRRRKSYLNGFTDCCGNHWCGQCYWRCHLIDLGEGLDYPALGHLQAGYDAWLHYARSAGTAGVEDAVRAAQKRNQARVPGG